MKVMDGSNNLEDILLKGFLNEVEKVEMLIYNTEKSIDQCRNKAKEIEHHIATTKLKVNNIPPDYSREIDSFITSYTIKCNMIIRSLLKRTFSSSFEGTQADNANAFGFPYLQTQMLMQYQTQMHKQ